MPTLTGAEPQLFIADMPAAVDFYTRKLRFAVAFLWGEPPYYGQVYRDQARFNLRCASPPVIDPDRRQQQELLSASVTVDDAAALFREFQDAGVDFCQTLQSKPWDAHDFIIRDPDGNLVLFTGRG